MLTPPAARLAHGHTRRDGYRGRHQGRLPGVTCGGGPLGRRSREGPEGSTLPPPPAVSRPRGPRPRPDRARPERRGRREARRPHRARTCAVEQSERTTMASLRGTVELDESTDAASLSRSPALARPPTQRKSPLHLHARASPCSSAVDTLNRPGCQNRWYKMLMRFNPGGSRTRSSYSTASFHPQDSIIV
jgi:hypothetical protein